MANCMPPTSSPQLSLHGKNSLQKELHLVALGGGGCPQMCVQQG